MFTIARSAAIFALFAVAAPALAQVSVADVPLDNDAVCPLVQPGSTVEAGVLAVVHFQETATATAANGLVTASAPVSLDVCLCLDASVTAGAVPLAVTLPIGLEANADAQTEAFIRANAGLNAALGVVDTILDGVGADLTVAVAPSNDIDVCVCPANAVPGCSSGGCNCTPCAAGETFSAATGVCVAIIVDPIPGPLLPSQAAGAAARMARARRSAAAGIYAGKQAKRADIVARMA